MAKNNTIRNNVFICDEDARFTFPRSSDFIFEKNIVYAKGKIVFDNTDALTTFKENILYSTEGNVQGNKMSRYSRTGFHKLQPDNNLFTDPLLVEFESGTVTFATKSPALQLGIKPIDISNAGVRPQSDD
jgi:hypothetical protein